MCARLNDHLIAKTAGTPNPKQVFQTENTRITVLAPELIRVEFGSEGTFTDKATQAIWYRDLGECNYGVEIQKKHFVVRTEKATFYVNPKRKKVDCVELDGVCVKANNKGNLGGTARTLDGTRGAIPIDKGVVSTNGVAVIEDGSLILDEDGEVKARAEEKDVYVFATKVPQRALELYYKITGAPPMVPRYALGNWWSRYRAYTQDEYLTLMNKFIEREIPFTVATIDMDWHWVDVAERFNYKSFKDSYICMRGWTGYSWNTDLFPDYRAFLKELKDKNLHITVNLHPASGVRSFENQYEEMCKEMDMDSSTGEPVRFDCTDPKYLNAYFKVLHKPYEREGVDFWWIDWQQGKWSKLKGLDPLWACNHFHTLDNAANGKRPLILSRYAGIGSHRYPLGFSGDASIIWPCLDFQPYFTANAANVGYTAWSHDIGGHHMGSPNNDELYLRWIQFGVFSPVMRLHSNNRVTSKEPWNHPTVEEEAIEYLRLRHSLIPYIYTAYYLNNKKSIPICKPLYYDYPEVKEAYKAKNEYMFGENLLVAPITAPIGKKGTATREVWLPEGRWTDIFTGETLSGGTHKVTRDLNSIPVYAKAGAIMPYGVSEGNDYTNPQELTIDVYGGANGAYTLYEDDGESTKYLNDEGGAFTDFTYADGVFTINAVRGDLSVVPATRAYSIAFHKAGAIKDVKLNGEACEYVVEQNVVVIKEVKPTDKVEIILG